MGLFDWFKRQKAKEKLKNLSDDDLKIAVDDYLKKTQKEHAETLQTAKKINQATLMEKSTRQLKQAVIENMQDSDDETDDEDDDEDDEPNDIGDKLINDLAQKFLSGVSNPQPSTATPTQTSDLENFFKNLSPDKQKKIIDIVKNG